MHTNLDVSKILTLYTKYGGRFTALNNNTERQRYVPV